MKETMLKNLKSSISDDKKIRRKIYSNEKDLNNIIIMPNNEIKPINKRNTTSNQEIIQNNLNISLLTYEKKPTIQNMYNNTTTNKMITTTKNEIPSNQSLFSNYMQNNPNLDNSILLRNSYTLNNLHKDKINDSSAIFQTQQDQSMLSASNMLNNINGRGSNGIKDSSSKKIIFDTDNSMRILNLEKKLDEMQSNLTSSTEDIVSINAKKFTIYRKIFEEYNSLVLSHRDSSLSSKISNGYNEIMNTILHQYSKVFEKLSTYGNISRKLVNTNKILEDKNTEILHLRAKLNESEKSKQKQKPIIFSIENNIRLNIKSVPAKIHKNTETYLNTNATNSELNNSYILPIENSVHNKLISGKIILKQEMNINMIDDLEALYFNDKVNMRSNSVNTLKKIPKLNFNVVDEKQKTNNNQNNVVDEKQTKTNNNQNNGNNIIVNMNKLCKIDEVNKHLKVNSKLN